MTNLILPIKLDRETGETNQQALARLLGSALAAQRIDLDNLGDGETLLIYGNAERPAAVNLLDLARYLLEPEERPQD